MVINPITVELCDRYKDTLADYIFQSVRNSHYMDSFSEKDAESKCTELREYVRENRAVCYGAFEKEALLGFVWAYEYPFRDDKKRLYISIIHVDEHHRGLHIGSQLLEKVYEYAGANGYSSIFLHTEAHNTNAQGFYRSMGFELERLQYAKSVNTPVRS